MRNRFAACLGALALAAVAALPASAREGSNEYFNPALNAGTHAAPGAAREYCAKRDAVAPPGMRDHARRCRDGSPTNGRC